MLLKSTWSTSRGKKKEKGVFKGHAVLLMLAQLQWGSQWSTKFQFNAISNGQKGTWHLKWCDWPPSLSHWVRLGWSPVSFIFIQLHILTFAYRVRAKLRDVAPDYDYTSNYFLRCLYHNEKGDPENPEEDFLRGDYLLRVSHLCSLQNTSNNWSISDISAHLYIPIFCLSGPGAFL